MKLEFKKALVPICIFYFALFFSFNLLFPYFTLQMRTLGLTLDDAALIGGIFWQILELGFKIWVTLLVELVQRIPVYECSVQSICAGGGGGHINKQKMVIFDHKFLS